MHIGVTEAARYADIAVCGFSRTVDNAPHYCDFQFFTDDRASGTVTVRLITDEAFTPADKTGAERVLRTYVPESFKCRVDISKLTPDEEMVAKKIMEAVEPFRPLIFQNFLF